MSQHSTPKTLFAAQAADAVSELQNVDNARHIVAAIDTSGSAALRVRFKGSIADEAPNFSNAQAADNQWDYLQLKDLESGASLAGATGLLLSGSDDNRMFEVNTNGMKWIVAEVSSHSAGVVTVLIRSFEEA